MKTPDLDYTPEDHQKLKAYIKTVEDLQDYSYLKATKLAVGRFLIEFIKQDGRKCVVVRSVEESLAGF